MRRVPMTIGGRDVGHAYELDVVDPASGSVIATVPECTPGELDQALAAALAAYPAWRGDSELRRECLAACAGMLTDLADDIAPLVTAEQGKPIHEAYDEVAFAGRWLRYYASLELPHATVEVDEGGTVEVRRRAFGPVAAITPWNFPVSSAFMKVAPALAAGNTVVLKPSPFTPLATLWVTGRLASVLPPGVLNVISGGDRLGSLLAQHPTVRKVSFTGSIATGMRVATAAAADLKRVTLELGGNDPAIVLDDVDIEAAAEGLCGAAFYNCGQVCTAVKRVYVPDSIYPSVVECLAERARAVNVGPGWDPDVDMGPVATRPQVERLRLLVADATRAGAQVVSGALPSDGDSFFRPMILAEATDGMKVVDEEQFGPVLPIVRYRSEDEAIERANGTRFGLGASVWTPDEERAGALTDRIESGTVWVNAHRLLGPEVPLSGTKWSGIGVENGVEGLLAYTEPQVVARMPLGAD